MGPLNFDEEYLRRLAAGDREVQQHFTNHFSPILRIKLRTKLRSPQLIEDVRQETFLRVLQTVGKGNGVQSPEKLGAFVNSVCNNVMMEGIRTSTRLRQMSEDEPEIVDETADPTENVVAQERRKLVARMLAELAPKDRNLLMQLYLEERDKDEICRDMHVNAEYLRVLIHRAKARCRTILNKASTGVH
jgi:RNA polymerase sigma-70 factor (ECF subfamily)